jgi:demethylmenaquinone methyltransferase/2-methoxy-6-polyprenyl-1,4-benzoquinol methylase
MKKGGSLLIIEFCWKNNYLLTFFMRLLIRSIGRFSDKESYRYLPNSVEGFYTQKEFLAMLSSCGFQELHSSTLFMGVAAIYTARKNE